MLESWSIKNIIGHKRRFCVFCAVASLSTVFLGACLLRQTCGTERGADFLLRVSDWKTGEIYASVPAKAGSTLFFGWIHSLEKIPWNEYYHVGDSGELILDAITFPAFGAGIPENKGRVCYVKNGLIHMEKIDQTFQELTWLNSHTATQDILLDGKLVAKGCELPQRTRLRLVFERCGE